MAIYVYTPGNPQAVPVQPFPNVFYPDIPPELLPAVDFYTQGRCGSCRNCPKYWRLDVPVFVAPGVEDYAGTVYLERRPYLRVGPEPVLRSGKCYWEQTGNCPVHLANNYRGPFGDGWVLVFQLRDGPGAEYDWKLYTPLEIGLARSVYTADNLVPLFNCLSPQTFRLTGNVEEFAFPYTPERLTITPVYP